MSCGLRPSPLKACTVVDLVLGRTRPSSTLAFQRGATAAEYVHRRERLRFGMTEQVGGFSNRPSTSCVMRSCSAAATS